jgi:hypothetical protein
MQIDGEYFIAQYPKKVTIRHMETVRVLASADSKYA